MSEVRVTKIAGYWIVLVNGVQWGPEEPSAPNAWESKAEAEAAYRQSKK